MYNLSTIEILKKKCKKYIYQLFDFLFSRQTLSMFLFSFIFFSLYQNFRKLT